MPRVLLVALLAASATAQPTVTPDALADDLALLRRTLEAVHPGLTLHRTPADVEAAFTGLEALPARLEAEHGGAIPVEAVYLPVAEFLAGFRDGHLQLNPYNQSGATRAALFDRADRVPFSFRLVGDRMLVTGDATPDRAVPPGTEILGLDGRPVAEIVEALLPYVRGDGGNDAKRRALLEVTGTAPAEDFDLLYSLVVAPSGGLEARVRRPDGVEATITVARTTRDARLEALAARDPDLPLTNDALLGVRHLDDGTAVVRVGTFATFNMETDYAAWLAEAFHGLRDAPRLVVDLRGNEGGMTDAAAWLLRHLLREPADVALWGSVVRYDLFPEALRPHVRSWGDDYLDLRGRVTPLGDGTYRLSGPSTLRLDPAPDAFPSPAAVLVDAHASSATFVLARAVQDAGAALLVGEPTGGSLRGFNGGTTVFLTLPGTGLVVDVPLIGSRPEPPGPDRGVIPDVVVRPSLEALAGGRDPSLEAAVEALRTGLEAPARTSGDERP